MEAAGLAVSRRGGIRIAIVILLRRQLLIPRRRFQWVFASPAAHATTVPHWSTQPTNRVGVPSSPPHTRNVMGTMVTAFRSGRWIHRIGDTRASLVVAS